VLHKHEQHSWSAFDGKHEPHDWLASDGEQEPHDWLASDGEQEPHDWSWLLPEPGATFNQNAGWWGIG
jgi:hypothetical protein